MMDISNEDINSLKNLSGKKFMITGGNGMLGDAFLDQLNKNVENAIIYCFNKSQLNIANPESFNKYLNLNPDFIIHCAGLVNADACEKNIQEGKINIVEGTKNVVNFAKKNNSKIFYPQSFLIYDGTNKNISEKTKPKPLSVYGNLKHEAENIILNSSLNALSVHMGGFFGGLEKDNNFVGKIIAHISKLIKNGKNSMEVGDRVWQPTFTKDLAYNSLLLLANNKVGKFCMSSHGSCSFFELTKKILEILGISEIFNILPISAKILAEKEIAIRPLSVIMKNDRLIKESLDRQRKWEISLKEYLSNQYFKNLFK